MVSRLFGGRRRLGPEGWIVLEKVCGCDFKLGTKMSKLIVQFCYVIC